jgi:hypothetical protein
MRFPIPLTIIPLALDFARRVQWPFFASLWGTHDTQVANAQALVNIRFFSRFFVDLLRLYAKSFQDEEIEPETQRGEPQPKEMFWTG